MAANTVTGVTWQFAMEAAFRLFLEQAVLSNGVIAGDHTQDTPKRVVKMFEEYERACAGDPRDYLRTRFSGVYDEMVHVRDIRISSLCVHHFKDIFGKAHFAYIPNGAVVGLSKIPRMIKMLAKRPQVQENLSTQIVDIFQETVAPIGCAVFLRAYHGCMIARGVEEQQSYTETVALRGVFKTDEKTRLEFLSSLDRSTPVFP